MFVYIFFWTSMLYLQSESAINWVGCNQAIIGEGYFFGSRAGRPQPLSQEIATIHHVQPKC